MLHSSIAKRSIVRAQHLSIYHFIRTARHRAFGVTKTGHPPPGPGFSGRRHQPPLMSSLRPHEDLRPSKYFTISLKLSIKINWLIVFPAMRKTHGRIEETAVVRSEIMRR